jgi:hypothetical protein
MVVRPVFNSENGLDIAHSSKIRGRGDRHPTQEKPRKNTQLKIPFKRQNTPAKSQNHPTNSFNLR